MHIKNLKINKKVVSILLALGLGVTAKGVLSEVNSYNNKTTLKDGRNITLYFSLGNSDNDYSYITLGNQVGYMENSNINFDNLKMNNDYLKVNGVMYTKDFVNVYLEPFMNDEKMVFNLSKNTPVNLVAKNINGWYVIYANNQTGFIHESYLTDKIEDICMAKITGNNVNVRCFPSTNDKNNIIGFCDISDKFEILGFDNDWYNINYLGQSAYVHKDYVKEVMEPKEDVNVKKMVYLTCDSPMYSCDGNILSYLPMYQNAFVLEEERGYYKVRIDGVVGYIDKNNTKTISGNCVVVDLGRQILKVYKNKQEVYRTHVITGKESTPSDIGYFTIGHHLLDYQLTPKYRVSFWMQYNGNEGLHDAYWQNDKYFLEVSENAYRNYGRGKANTYPNKHGSNGCINLKYEDAEIIYSIININDHVLVIGPNNLVNDMLLSKEENIKIKKLV